MKLCPACGSEKVYQYKKTISTGGAYSEALVPGIGWMRTARLLPVVCTSCGLVRLFANEETRTAIEESTHWSPA